MTINWLLSGSRRRRRRWRRMKVGDGDLCVGVAKAGWLAGHGLAWHGFNHYSSSINVANFSHVFFGTQMCKVKNEKQKTWKEKAERKEIKINENENGCRWQFYSLFGQIVVRRGAGRQEGEGGMATNSCMRWRTEYKLSSWKTSAKCHLSYFSVERRQSKQQQKQQQ